MRKILPVLFLLFASSLAIAIGPPPNSITSTSSVAGSSSQYTYELYTSVDGGVWNFIDVYYPSGTSIPYFPGNAQPSSVSTIDVFLNGSATEASGYLRELGGYIRVDFAASLPSGTRITVILKSVTTPTTAATYNVKSVFCTGSGISLTTHESTLTFSSPPPSAPTANAASSITSASFSANWSSTSGATKYFLDVSENNTFSTFLSGYENKDVGNVTTSSVTGLTAGVQYYYRVRAYNASGTSGNSNTISLTTAKLSQTITFNALSTVVYGSSGFNLNATASSGLTVSYTSSNTAVATISGSAVTVVGAGTTTITASQSGNSTYNAATNVQQTLTVSKKELIVSGALVSNKVYDGTTTVAITGASLSGVVDPDDVSLENASSGSFTSPQTGTEKTVVTSMSVTGADAGNYTLIQPVLTGVITPKDLNIEGAVVADKIYDGTTLASLTGATLQGVVGSDDVAIDEITAAFSDKNIGPDKVVTAGFTLKGADKNNYNLLDPGTFNADILAAELSFSDVLVADKIYDGNTEAQVTNAVLVGVIGSDEVMLDELKASFADKNVGTLKVVAASFTLKGSGLENYTVTQPAGLSADIAQKELMITGIEAQSKVYDGTTNASLSTGILEGIVGTDEVSLVAGNGAFVSSDAGSGIEITANGYSLSGADASNYFVNQPSGLKADITPAQLVVTANDVEYQKGNGTISWSLSYSGFVNGENEEVLDVKPELSCPAIETSPVGEYDITAGGGTDNNYVFEYVNGTLSIMPGTGISGASGMAYQIYPNPATDFVNIRSPHGNPVQVQLFDMNGRLIINLITVNDQLDIQGLIPGIYNLRVDGHTFRLMKQ